MPVVSPPMNNGAPYAGSMGYGPPVPQPSVHGPPPYAYQQAYYSQQGPGGHMLGPVPMSTPIPSQMTYHDQAEMARKMRDYEALTQIITQWNANRLDLFALSLPNEVGHHFIRRLLEEPPVNPWVHLYQYYNIDPKEGL